MTGMGNNHTQKIGDKFVGLPRSLLDNILNRVPIRDAARTSILSRKWRYIWSEIPQLVFDQNFFEAATKNKQLSATKFVSVISKVLLLHNGTILKFVLYIPNIMNDWEVHISQWLLFLSRNGLKEISIHNSGSGNLCKMHSSLFYCSELTHLKLRSFVLKPPSVLPSAPDLYQLPNLISLNLEYITFLAPLSTVVFYHAPLLESLRFRRCIGIKDFPISAPKLKTFWAIESGNVRLNCLESTPNLTILSISLGKIDENQGHGRKIKLTEFLGNVPKVSKVSFDGFFLQLLDAGITPGELSVTFHQLELLQLYGLRFNDLNTIYCVLWFLKSSPNLRKLDIKFLQASEAGDNSMELDLRCLEAPDCMLHMLNQLQTVEMTSINGFKAELLLIKQILFCSPLLEKILVQYSRKVDAKEGFRISKELMRFSRASTKAEIVYTES